MSSTILLVEDDPILARGLKLSLELDGFEIFWAMDHKSALKFIGNSSIDLYILDWNLGDGTGLDICEKLRADGNTKPVIFLTARSDEESAVQALGSGANDFVRKPFSQAELFARIKVLLKGSGAKLEKLQFGSLTAFPRQRKALFNEQEIDLNRREFDILVHLMKNAEAVVSRDEILNMMNREGEIFDRTVDSHLSHLRKKLRSAEVAGLQISSIYGVGYRLEKL